MAPGTADRWEDADAYERYMGRWSRRLARDLVAWLGVPPGAHWLEVGCGTGALTAAILDGAAPGSVTACDAAAGYAGSCAARLHDPRLRVVVAGADSLPERAGGYDAVASSLVLNFLRDPVEALGSMGRMSAAGGRVAAAVWDYGEGMELLRHFWDAAVATDARAAPLHEGRRFAICRADVLRDAFVAAGLAEVDVVALTVPMPFPSFEDLWAPFLDGPGPAPTYVASLPGPARDALRERLRAELPASGDGAVDLRARAWAARGTVRPAPPGS